MDTGSSPKTGLYPPFPLISALKVAASGLLSGGSVSASSAVVMERLGEDARRCTRQCSNVRPHLSINSLFVCTIYY